MHVPTYLASVSIQAYTGSFRAAREWLRCQDQRVGLGKGVLGACHHATSTQGSYDILKIRPTHTSPKQSCDTRTV